MNTEIFDLQRNDRVAIVGTGGKTSLLFALGRFYKRRFPVILSTTTKIYYPEELEPDESVVMEREFTEISHSLTVLGGTIKGKKIIGFDHRPFPEKTREALLLYEGDGSRGLPLKGWNDDDPVIAENTTVTIGVFPLWGLGLPVNERTCFRPEIFRSRFSPDDSVDVSTLETILKDSRGLFKGAMGRKILFLNGEDRDRRGEEVGKRIQSHFQDIHVIVGSVRKEYYYDFRDRNGIRAKSPDGRE